VYKPVPDLEGFIDRVRVQRRAIGDRTGINRLSEKYTITPETARHYLRVVGWRFGRSEHANLGFWYPPRK